MAVPFTAKAWAKTMLPAIERDLAGLRGYVTSLAACPGGTPVAAEFVIGSYHKLRNIEKELHRVKARPAGTARLQPQARLHRSPPG